MELRGVGMKKHDSGHNDSKLPVSMTTASPSDRWAIGSQIQFL